jgi:hypothetical protein
MTGLFFRQLKETIMHVAIPLDKMDVTEKLRVLEEVWDSLCHSREDVPSPAWHGEVLRDRDQRIREGKSKFIDLAEAKRRVWDQV